MKHPCTTLKWVCLLLCLSVSMMASAQGEKTYTGILTDKNNAGVAGVTVEVQEKDISTVTDAEGRFTLSAEPTDVLVFKKPGYLTTLFPLSRGITDLKAVLEPAKVHAGDADEVEIPSGTRKRRYLTGAVSSVRADDLPQPSTSALTNVLSGRLAGLNVLQIDTRPGSDFSTFQVRGLSAFGGRDALVLVDGAERELQDLDLSEIENITVLKDAASLAWYGMRGANGVVLVTTRKGSATQSGIRFQSQVGFQRPDHLIEPLNSYDYATLYNEAQLNDNPDASPVYDQNALDAFRNRTDPYRFPDNNYVDQFLRKSSPISRHVVSASGGSSRVRYYAMLGYLNQQGLFAQTSTPNFNTNNTYNRVNFRGTIDFDVTNSLTVSVNLAGRSELRKNPHQDSNTGEILGMIYNTRPDAYPIRNPDGSFGGNVDFQSNILGELTSRGFRTNIQRVGLATVTARQKLDNLLKGLSAHVLATYDAQGDYTHGRRQDYEVVDQRNENAPLVYGTEIRLGYLNTPFNAAFRSNELWAGFDYDRAFGDHQINASVRGMRATRIPFSTIDERVQGLSGRVEYSFRQRYLLGLTAGYSGVDNLPPGDRYGFFPAVSAGWIVSDEKFLAGNRVLSYLKLRASYGQSGNGNVDFGRRFPYRTSYVRSFTGGGYQFGNSFSTTNSAREFSIGNPLVTWETLTTTNAGVDFDLFKSALSATVDVFQNRRTGILTAPSVPSILGQFTGNEEALISDVNEGIVENRGIESSLFYNRQLGRLALSLNANLLLSADKIVNQGGQSSLPAYQSSIGHPVGTSLYYISDGIYQNTDEIAAHGVTSTLSANLVPGDIRYMDQNSDGVIDAFDRVRLDKRFTPGSYFGFGTVLRYGIFDLNAQFAGVAGRTIDISNVVIAGPNGFNRETFGRWTPATAAAAQYPRLGLADQGHNRAPSDFWLRDGDYVKLRTLELGVNLPRTLASKIRTQGVRLYLSAYNAFTFTKLNLNVDPELPYAGRLSGAYPYTRTFSVGLSAEL